jgi:hypothetical protein
MKRIKIRVAIAFVIVSAGVVGWVGTKQYRCKKRNAEFSRRIEVVEKDAREQLKVGTKKDSVARFYKEHEIPFEVVRWDDTEFQAIGTLFTIGGCAPLGCGTDNALIGVRVRVDAEGTVTGEPKVVNMYTNCL